MKTSETDSVSNEPVRPLDELAADYGLEFLQTVPRDALDPSLIRDLSVEWARANVLLPVRLGGDPCVLTADPGRVDQQEYLALLLGTELRPVVAAREEILACIEHCYYQKDDTPDGFIRDMDDAPEAASAPARGGDDLFVASDEAPVAQLVNLILLEAVKQGASDVHLEPFESALRVRYRLDGVLYAQSSPPKHLEEALISRVKVMAHMDIAEKRLPQDGMARVRVGEREIDIRVSTVPVAEGERVVLRLLDSSQAYLPLTDLGMTGSLLESFHELLVVPNGMVIVCGPTGSGKTTTLYAALGQLDTERKNVLTIEDPIEYQLPSIGQIQVKPKIGLGFAHGLRHILRQDPDIILVGETRDLETASIAVRAALTGHLVFTTLHTNDAAGAVTRLTDMGVEPFLLASCLRGVLAQRLVRRLCDTCRKETTVMYRTASVFGDASTRVLGRRAWEPVGCERCREGYLGRTGIFELLLVDAATRELIRSGKSPVPASPLSTASSTRRPMLDDGLAKALEGITSLSEILEAMVAIE